MQDKVIEKLAEFGQSIWLDNINRSMLDTGALKDLIDSGIRGVTSNPSIFDKAISKSNVYNNEIEKLHGNNATTFEIYDDLTVKDIQDAADSFKSVYESTKGLDGYVSLEINPKLAYNVKESIEEGKRLHKKVNRANLMLKVPATNEGSQAIEALIGEGFNVNATLIFSIEQYINTAGAYIKGIKRLLDKGKDFSCVHSVASVFISRIDTAVDNLIDQAQVDALKSLKGRAAVANSNLIYEKYLDIFSSEDFNLLKAKGVNAQRVLWASTSTKNPDYSDIKYVEELIAKNTVNTLPEVALDAFMDHGTVKEALTSDIKSSQDAIDTLKDNNIDVNKVCSELLKSGVIAFEKSFESLLGSIEEKTKSVCKK